MSLSNIYGRREALQFGLPTYFSGKPCKNGHLTDRRTSSSTCVVCAKARTQAWNNANGKQKNAVAREWEKSNPDKRRQYDKDWRAANPGADRQTEDCEVTT